MTPNSKFIGFVDGMTKLVNMKAKLGPLRNPNRKLMAGINLIIWMLTFVHTNNFAQQSGNSAENYPGTYYSNPIFEPILADPTVFRDPRSGEFYAYGTQDDWGDGQGSRLITILRSDDLVKWKVVGEAFESKPTWKERGGLWAPDINCIDGKYYLYYSYSVWADPNPGIGLAIADHPGGPFQDQGKIFMSDEVGVPNSIDPFFWEEDGRKYLFWGSYNNSPEQGTYVLPLADDGKSVPDMTKKVKIAAGDFEGVAIHYRNGFYYFFGSKGNCCDGAETKYHVKTGRSKNLMGPYLDKDGRPLKQRGNGTLLIQGNGVFVGPGHNSRIITDDQGTDWLIYHGIDVHQGKVSSGATRRMLMMDPIIWEDDWPVIRGQSPSTTPQKAPVIKN